MSKSECCLKTIPAGISVLKKPSPFKNMCMFTSALDDCQRLSIDYVPVLKHRIINESQDNSNRSDLSNDLAEFRVGNVQNEKGFRENTFTTGTYDGF